MRGAGELTGEDPGQAAAPRHPAGGRNSSASITLNSVALAPVPSARLSSRTAVVSLLRARPRRA